MPLRTIASLDLEAKETALAEIARMYPQTQPTPTPTYTAASIPVASEVVPAAATVHPDEMAAAIAPIFARMDQITRQIAGIESSLAGLTNHVALTAKREEAIYTAVTKKAEPLPTEDEQSCHAYIVGLGRRYYTKNADGTPDGEDHKSSVESLLNGAGSPTNGFLPLRRLANMAYESVRVRPRSTKMGTSTARW